MNGGIVFNVGEMITAVGYACEREREDAAFIAHARQDIPALLQEIERLTAERDDLAAYPKRPIPTFASPVEELDYWRTEAINLDTWYAVATEARADLESRLARLTADHAALRSRLATVTGAVKEFQVAREAWFIEAVEDGPASERYENAKDALSSLEAPDA